MRIKKIKKLLKEIKEENKIHIQEQKISFSSEVENEEHDELFYIMLADFISYKGRLPKSYKEFSMFTLYDY